MGGGGNMKTFRYNSQRRPSKEGFFCRYFAILLRGKFLYIHSAERGMNSRLERVREEGRVGSGVLKAALLLDDMPTFDVKQLSPNIQKTGKNGKMKQKNPFFVNVIRKEPQKPKIRCDKKKRRKKISRSILIKEKQCHNA